jgi:UDP-2,4-diacetamido-2,4,6-trideoxy-beta-L-altropyranose hydrolase
MNIAIRTDASLKIGTGHVMRCLTLASELKKLGAKVDFICRAHDGNLIERIKQDGYIVHSLATDPQFKQGTSSLFHANWLGASQNEDAKLCKSILEKLRADWIIVDHYSIDILWEKEIRTFVKRIMVIDDLADRKHDCDLLLDQNLGRVPSDYSCLVPNNCSVLVGPSNALIREEFWKLRYKKKNVNKYKPNILIFFGGTDIQNYTGRTITLFHSMRLTNVEVIIGRNNINQEKIKSVCSEMNYNCHVETNQMERLMHKSDIYVGAGGCTILERIIMRLPSITISIAENQIAPLKFFAQTGACIYLGNGKMLSDKTFKEAILTALNEINTLTNNCEALCEEFFSERPQWLQKLFIKQ